MKTLSAICISLTITFFSCSLMGQKIIKGTNSSAGLIIETIIHNTKAETIPNTVDVIKEGDPDVIVTGIISTMFATMDVMKQAVSKNCNLIIVHEPLYYNHRDETKQFKDNQVFLEKQRYIKDHNLVIWRFHDYIHRMKPDGIYMGMVAKLGWKDYIYNNDLTRYVLPKTNLKSLLKDLKVIFPKNTFYVIGDPEMKLSKVSLAVGAPGSMVHIMRLEDKDVDVLLAGESPQWETYEYMRDAVDQGREKAIIFLGHIASEEAGMEYCADWLKTFLIDMPVTFIESGPSYWAY